MPLRTIKTGTLYRAAKVDRAAIDQEARTVELAFSSEEPVERWGVSEILDHSPSSIRLGRLKNGGPVLVDHDGRDHVGVIESVSVDSDRRGRAVVRFGNSARATEIFQDVVDGIRSSVSVGYRILKAVLEEAVDGGRDIYRVTDWEPLEVSMVSVPADASVGVGRSDGDQFEFSVEIPQKEQRAMPDKINPPAVDVVAIESAARAAALKGEQERTRTILDLASKHNQAELGRQFIENGQPTEAFQLALLERMGMKPVQAEAPDIGMSAREADRFSFVRALNFLANPGDMRARKAAEFELEASRAAADKMGRNAQGLIVPVDVLKRDLVVGTPTAGGNLVATDLLSGSFIDMLRNLAVMMQPGMATVLTDLNGNIAIPKQTGGATGYWLAEGAAPTESQQVIGQVAMSPKTVGAFTEYTRKLLQQSSIDVENFVRGDIARTLALMIDAAVISGTGADDQPTGILNTAGIGAVVGGTNGAAPDWADIVNLETEVAIDNADVGNLRYLTNAKVRGKLKQTEKVASTAQFIWDGKEMNGYEAMVTNQVPSNLTKGTASGICSAILYGNFADVLIGMWGGLDLTVNPYANDTSGGVRVVGLQDVDVAVRNAQSFAAMLDALTA